MDPVIVKFGGGTSNITLYKDYLVIKPSNIQPGAAQTIPLSSVVTVSIVKPFLKTPYLQIITPGMVPSKSDNMKGASANVVLIQPGQMGKAKKIQEYVLQYKTRSVNQPSSGSNLSDLEKLDELKKKGIITQAEFDAKKKQILGL